MFMAGIAAIIFFAFLITFRLLAEDSFTPTELTWVLVKVFLGSSYLGFDIMSDIDPTLGPPLMLIYVCMTNILLITTLISILSGSFSKLFAHARDEYLFVYSVYVLEASTSNRLTHFYPPLNLIPLILIRPFRLFLPASHLRRTRIILLKITHAPIVACIWLFERVHERINKSGANAFSSTNPKLTSTILKRSGEEYVRSKTEVSSVRERVLEDRLAAKNGEFTSLSAKNEELVARERVLEDRLAVKNEEFTSLSAKNEELVARGRVLEDRLAAKNEEFMSFSAQIEVLSANSAKSKELTELSANMEKMKEEMKEEMKALIIACQGTANEKGV